MAKQPTTFGRVLDWYGRLQIAWQFVPFVWSVLVIFFVWLATNPGLALLAGAATFALATNGLVKFDDWRATRRRPLMVSACGTHYVGRWQTRGIKVTLHDVYVKNLAKSGGEKLQVWFELRCLLDGTPYTISDMPYDRLRKEQLKTRTGDIWDHMPNPKEIEATDHYREHLTFIILDYPGDPDEAVLESPVLYFRHDRWAGSLQVPGVWTPRDGAKPCP